LLGVVAAAGVLAAVALHLVMVYGGAGDIVIGTPYLGLYVTVIGAVLALAASLRARNLRRSGPSSARPAPGQALTRDVIRHP
jgi:hypothetical protein